MSLPKPFQGETKHDLRRMWNAASTRVMLDANHSAFLGSLLCTLNFTWSYDIPTAATDGINLWWNPDFCAQYQTDDERKFVIMHELWHVARLHPIRRGERDPEDWNIACDIRINNDMIAAGYSYGGLKPVFDRSLDQNGILSEEDIYEIVKKKRQANGGKCPYPGGAFGGANDGDPGDVFEGEDGKAMDSVKAGNLIAAVQQAVVQSKLMGKEGDTTMGQIEEMIDAFLAPVVDWRTVLKKYFTDLGDQDYSWKRPNRRHQEIYLPSLLPAEGRLQHIRYYLDVSGSCSDEDIRRFNSELKYIIEILQPEKITLVQFSDRITKVEEYQGGQQFEYFMAVGRGGTRWVPICEDIEEHKPDVAVIFTDMGFHESRDKILPPKHKVPIIWAIQNNPKHIPNFGQYIHIEE